MIEKNKEKNSFESLHAVLITARKYAYDGKSYEDIAYLLDEADYLLTLILDERDLTVEFRKHLETIANKLNWYFPLERFDR